MEIFSTGQLKKNMNNKKVNLKEDYTCFNSKREENRNDSNE